MTSTPKYKLLYQAFGWEVPTYVHLPLIMGKNEDGSVSKLSKRHGSTGFDDLIKEGYLPQTIVNYIALLGWCPKENRELFTMQELIENFSIDGISKSPSVFDYDKLTWFNGEYIRAMSSDEFISNAMPYFKEVFPDRELNWQVLASILQPRVTKFTQIPEMIAFFKDLQEYPTDFFINKKSKTNLENSVEMLNEAISVLEKIDDWSVDVLHVLSKSKCLSADVSAAFDPTYASAYEATNSCYINNGVGMAKYTGSRGKSGSSEATAEFVASVRNIFDQNQVLWQIGELGKVDGGGGGTVAVYIANLNVDVLDVGVPVLSMHAPLEVVSKLDVYMTYKGIKAFYEAK